jgi:hypothetical protein
MQPCRKDTLQFPGELREATRRKPGEHGLLQLGEVDHEPIAEFPGVIG